MTQENQTFGKYYIITVAAVDLLKCKFGEQAQNDVIVDELNQTLKTMKEKGILSGGAYPIKVDGPMSVPVSMCVGHHLAHIYEAVAARDPKMSVSGNQEYILPDGQVIKTVLDVSGKPVPAYVVAVAHGGSYKEGQVIA